MPKVEVEANELAVLSQLIAAVKKGRRVHAEVYHGTDTSLMKNHEAVIRLGKGDPDLAGHEYVLIDVADLPPGFGA